MKRGRRSQKRKKSKFAYFIICFSVIIVGIGGVYLLFHSINLFKQTPEDLIAEYMSYIEAQNYEAMFAMTDNEFLDKEAFIQRNSKIYEGIEASDFQIKNIEMIDEDGDTIAVSYDTSFDTMAGEINFSNEAYFDDTKDGYKLIWTDSLIFPNLQPTDKVSVSTSKAQRGEILDRSGKILAGQGIATSVGVVPGKLENKEKSLQEIAELLNIETETIEKKLSAGWVKDDSFVPIATVKKLSDLDLTQVQPSEESQIEYAIQQNLLEIPGVMFSDLEVRSYNYGAAASHLIGYVQNVTAEDLEDHPDEGYTANSVIGKSGMEGLYEKELKGQNGCEISIIDKNGNTKEVLAEIIKQDGEDIQLTIDADLQRSLYEEFKDAPGCSVAMNPYTGEVLALVSTPSYDSNDFILGLSTEQWAELNESEDRPLYNRFRQVWCPGSTFKPIVAAIGLETGAINSAEDFGNEGLSWQKDTTWGSYYVTTLHEYEPVILKNALIYSDNIYFAKAALKIGSENLMNSLDKLGFNQELPFEIVMAESQYSNTEIIETEIQLADSGYGQGQVLINPLHLASIYTAFLNNGDVIKPHLKYEEEANSEVWIEQVFSETTIDSVLEGMNGVVNNPNGTAYAAHREDVVLAGKTGTAELKTTKDDTTSTEIGWFAVFTEETDVVPPVLIVSMVENVKGIGGSNYVVEKDVAVLEEYLQY